MPAKPPDQHGAADDTTRLVDFLGSIDLGEVSGIAYYTVEPAGFRIVATVAQGDAGTPVRLEAVLAPDQSVVLSTPREGRIAPNAIEISRRGDQLLVHQTAVTN